MSKIFVIADDFSGAAEIAGVAVGHGLAAEVQTAFVPGVAGEVICVDSDTRLLEPSQAARQVADLAARIAAAKPAWIFKKCDSVLRGPVLAEARAIAGATDKTGIMILPANPTRGRIIRGGNYFVQGEPLHKTVFALDPAHPRTTSSVAELLGADLSGVITPDAETASDLVHYAATLGADTLPVGGADFFRALLETRVPSRNAPVSTESTIVSAGETLLVCGSAAAWEKRYSEASSLGIPVFTIPHEIAKMAEVFRSSRRVLVGIGGAPGTHALSAAGLVDGLAQSVGELLRRTTISRLLLEGGATAAAVVREMGWTRLSANKSSGRGIGVLRPVAENHDELTLYVKPGSYPWPEVIWPGPFDAGK